jgi:hypothetical protein
MKLLFIGGMQRSGTRFMVNVLNKSSHFNILNEIITGGVLKNLMSLDRSIYNYRSNHEREKIQDPECYNRQVFVMRNLSSIQKVGRKKFEPESNLVQGIKHPRIDIYWSWLTEVFKELDFGLIFCCRDFRETYLSMLKHPGITVTDKWMQMSDALDYWLESIERYLEIDEANQNEDHHLLIPFPLGDFVASKDQRLFLWENIIEPIKKYYDLTEIIIDDINLDVSTNSSKNLTGIDRRMEFSEDEKDALQQLLDKNPHYEDVLRSFNETSGLNLTICGKN